MKRLTLLILVVALAFSGAASANEVANTTRAISTLNNMFVQNGAFGFPPFGADPFTCSATTERAMYYNTATKLTYVCNGTSWVGLGGLSSPITGDFVATGKWTFGSAADAAGSVRIGETANCIVIEGSLDGFETSICATDPTVGDQVYNFPDRAGAVASDTVATGGNANLFTGKNTFGSAVDAANSVRLGETAGAIVFEGSTLDANETTVSVADPGGAVAITIPATSGTLATLGAVDQVFTNKITSPNVVGSTNVSALGVDAANGVTLKSNGVEFEGSVDNFETTLTAADPTVGDQSYSLPNRAGVVTDTIATLGADNTFTGTETFTTGTTTFGGVLGAANTISLNETAGQITAEGSGSDNFEMRLAFANPSADETITFPEPNAGITATIAYRDSAQSWTGAQSMGSGSWSTAAASSSVFYIGGANGGSMWYGTESTPDGPRLNTGTTSNSWNMMEYADFAYDFQNGPCGTSACTDPSLIGHSHNQATNQWWSLTHDGVSSIQDSGLGGTKERLAGVTRAWWGSKTYTFTTATPLTFLNVAVPNDTGCAITVEYFAVDQDADEIRMHNGKLTMMAYELPGGAGTYACKITETDEDTLNSAGTLTDTYACTAAATTAFTATFTENAALTTPTSRFLYNVTHNSGCVLSQP